MLECCNRLYNGSFSYVYFSSEYYYRRVEFGVCPNPNCLCPKFKDFRILYDGTEQIKVYTGKEALRKFEQWRKKLLKQKHGTKGNQNVYYGDFRKTNRRDPNGNVIYLQLRKNFNNQAEVMGEVKTKIYR